MEPRPPCVRFNSKHVPVQLQAYERFIMNYGQNLRFLVLDT